MGLLEKGTKKQRKTTPLSNSSFICLMTIFEILKHVKYVSCQIFICFVTSNKKLDLTSVSVLRIHHFFFLNRYVKIRKWRDQKSVQRIWVGCWGWGLSCGFTVSPWSGGCLTIPVSSCCSIQDISSTEPISSEKLTDPSKKPEGTYLTSYNPMPLKIVWR